MKTQAFEYIIDQLVIWHNEKNQSDDNYKNKFTKLFLLKMLFFVSAVNADDKNNDLLDTFDNFVAMPLGPVESTIYDAIGLDKLSKYNISDKILVYKSDGCLGLDPDLKAKIDSALLKLRVENDNLINYSAFDLVDLSHKWSCWRVAFEYARSMTKSSIKMPTELIIMSDKYFI